MKNESLLIVLGISFQLCNDAVCLISLLYRVFVCMYVYFVHSMCVYYQIWLTVTGKTYCDFLNKSQAFFPFLKFNQLLFFHWTTKYNTTVNWDLEKCNNMGYFRNSIVNINYDKSHWNNDNKLKWGTTCVSIGIWALYIASIIIISQCYSFNHTQFSHDFPNPKRLRISSLTVYLLFPRVARGGRGLSEGRCIAIAIHFNIFRSNFINETLCGRFDYLLPRVLWKSTHAHARNVLYSIDS